MGGHRRVVSGAGGSREDFQEGSREAAEEVREAAEGEGGGHQRREGERPWSHEVCPGSCQEGISGATRHYRFRLLTSCRLHLQPLVPALVYCIFSVALRTDGSSRMKPAAEIITRSSC